MPVPKLFDYLMDMGTPVFAALDGAQFDDLPEALFDGGFDHRPLYTNRGGQGRSFPLTAPQLVRLDRWAAGADGGVAAATALPGGERDAETHAAPDGPPDAEVLAALLSIAGDRPAAVFWACPAGHDALYRHLRGINMVMYPKEMLPDVKDDGDASAETHEAVLFRYTDANVMAQTAPALNLDEACRFLGPCDEVCFSPDVQWREDNTQLLIFRADDNGIAAAGMLKLSEETVERIAEARYRKSDRNIVRYLKKVCPDRCSDLDNKELFDWVVPRSAEARRHGVRTEAARGRWCYIQMLTKDGLSDNNEVGRLMAAPSPRVSPDQRVRHLLLQAIANVEGAT